MRLSLPALLLAALLACAAPAVAAPGDDIGATVRIVNLVTGTFAKDERDLAKGDPVRQDELIEVSEDGIGEIRLRDDTELALGPGSQLLLDEFVYNPDISGGAIVLDLVQGAFRFITGLAAKPAYVIRTPTASITVRGTIFDVYVEAVSGISWLLLVEGAIEACNQRQQCKELDEPGKLLRITPDGVVGDPLTWPDLPTGDLEFATAFPFIVTPPTVDPDPVFTPEEIVDGKIPDGPIYDEDDDAGDDTDTDTDDGDVDEIIDDSGPPPPPLTCWRGWKKVHKGWGDDDAWIVKRRHRGGRTIYCARRRDEDIGPPVIDLPPKPECFGGKVVMLKTFPPRWRCLCPGGQKRISVGPHHYVCKGKPGGGGGPKKECKKKGWFWFGGICIPKLGKCPKGYVGKVPNCKKLPPEKCPKGMVGKPPNCKKIGIPETCPKGSKGKWPNCKKVIVVPPKACPKGTIGKWPKCKTIVKPKPDKKKCPFGTVGKWPNCKKLIKKPKPDKPKPDNKKNKKKCPFGTVGKWPDCKKVIKLPSCPKGTVGKWPKCKKL